ncbi:HPr family phosphocarrier protein [Brevibacterium litoralis]|uniref:HPr family phosphocarrier protein n=1 Tax=Brevibacterium litoralis TaxID=3138935 RepID=UPI0032EABAF2
MAQVTAVVASKVGLHARPAAIISEAAGELDTEVTIGLPGDPADEAMDVSSVLSLMALGAEHGQEVVLFAEGEGAEAALEQIKKLIETDHDA